MPVNDLYSTTEAAAILGLAAGSVRGAVARGSIAAVQVAGRNLVPKAELERYQREVQNRQGWETRKQPDYTPNTKQRVYQQKYYARRKKAAHKKEE